MKKFSSIEEIREEIDEVDIQILDLIFNTTKNSLIHRCHKR